MVLGVLVLSFQGWGGANLVVLLSIGFIFAGIRAIMSPIHLAYINYMEEIF
jgi:hypothetical protein